MFRVSFKRMSWIDREGNPLGELEGCDYRCFPEFFRDSIARARFETPEECRAYLKSVYRGADEDGIGVDFADAVIRCW